MTSYSWVGATLLLLPTAALAQTPPDVAALAKSVQKLSLRLDRLQKDYDGLKKDHDRLSKQVGALKGSVPAASSVAVVTPPPPPLSNKVVAVPGWEVEIVPNEDTAKDSVGNFDWNDPEFNFGIHMQKKLVNGHNPYTYKGLGILRVGEPGRYVVSLTLQPLRWGYGNFICAGNVKINGELLVEGRLNSANASGDYDRKGNLYAIATYSGGSKLEPPDAKNPDKGYQLTFEVACYLDERDKAHLSESAFTHWEDNRFSILIKGPHDPRARPFRSNELYHEGDVAQP